MTVVKLNGNLQIMIVPHDSSSRNGLNGKEVMQLGHLNFVSRFDNPLEGARISNSISLLFAYFCISWIALFPSKKH